MSNPVALVAAGGTGGHLFPAHALTSELVRRGWDVHLVSDDRALSYGIEYPGTAVHTVASATVRGRNPMALMQTAWGIGRGWLQSRALLRRLKPQIVIGFGGYPTLPPLLAARFAGVPYILHESNGVMGRANKLMMSRAAAVATSLDRTDGLEDFTGKVEKTGNPVRDNVLAQAGRTYPNRKPDERFNLLIFGGSQGARVFSEVVPEAMAELPTEMRQRLRVIQQCRPEDLSDVASRYERLGLDAHLANFIEDIFGVS